MPKKTADETVKEIEQEIAQESAPPPESEPAVFKKVGVETPPRRLEPMVIMPKPVGGPERRLYQPNAQTKEWLTKEQAEALGFPWN